MRFSDPLANVSQFDLPEGSVVVDIGAGTGHYTIPLGKKVGTTGKVYAVDVQKELLDKLKSRAREEHISNIEIVWADGERAGGTGLRDGIATAVLFSNVLFQMPEKPEALKEAMRVLRPGGAVYIIDWADSFGNTGPRPEDVLTELSSKQLAADAGFSYEGRLSVGAHHYGLVFRKK